jgi:DNA-binding NarL/FixJ family response regulator
MQTVLFAAKNFSGFSSMVEFLRDEPGVELVPVPSGAAAMQLLQEKPIHLLIAADNLEDMSGLDCLKQVAKQFPLVYTALCSTLSHEDFHESTEGLGVLMQLSLQPGKEESAKMLAQLQKINALLSS